MKALTEISLGQRFAFGQNWKEFLKNLNEPRIEQAIQDLKSLLGVESLQGLKFLDIGSGSGLMSLAAYRLGATVQSFDYDPQSVECTKYLRNHYARDGSSWEIEQGSVLDLDFLKLYSEADIVYSWGVLHHTGNMWQALENVAGLVKKDGLLAIAIYNDQGLSSKIWWHIKKLYVSSPLLLKHLIVAISMLRLWGPRTIIDLCKLRPFHTWKNYHSSRGMSAWHDVVDWVGGFPFEVASIDSIFTLYSKKEFYLKNIISVNGRLGCNQFVFRKR